MQKLKTINEKEFNKKIYLTLFSAVKAVIAVYGYQHTAFGTFIFFCLDLGEFFNPVFFNKIKIFNHAHTVFFPISLIQPFKAQAGIFITFIAVISFIFTFFY